MQKVASFLRIEVILRCIVEDYLVVIRDVWVLYLQKLLKDRCCIHFLFSGVLGHVPSKTRQANMQVNADLVVALSQPFWGRVVERIILF